VKDHTHKDGTKIGTTLLAAALTCHPFLESMQAVTLYSFSAMGDLALTVPQCLPTTATVQLAEVGQRVSFIDDPEHTPELTDEERTHTFIVKATFGEGDEQFVRLTTVDGAEFGWFRTPQLAPADAPRTQEDDPRPEDKEMETMSDVISAAANFGNRVKALVASGRHVREAIDLASAEDKAGAHAYRLAHLGSVTPTPEPVISLSVRPGESFDELVTRYASEKGVPLRRAISEVGLALPDLARAR
jgi:hypothetical protein